MVRIGNIPVYNAVLIEEGCGMERISLVEDPAVITLWQKFSKDAKPMNFAIQSEEQRRVLGVVMRANFPIYREDEAGNPYYIVYSPATIKEMAERYLAENRQNAVNLMHRPGSDVTGVDMVQFFIVDRAKGVDPMGFLEVADGSLMAEFHVTNDDVWQAIKAGTYKGFSLEGTFNVVEAEDGEAVKEMVEQTRGLFARTYNNFKLNMKKNLVRTLRSRFASILKVTFGKVTTDKGVLVWEGEEDLKAGDAVSLEAEDGALAEAEPGDYMTEDGKRIVVADGVVAEIVDPEAEVETGTEEMEGEEPEAEAEVTADPLAELVARMDALEARVAELEARNAQTEEAIEEVADVVEAQTEELKRVGGKSLDVKAHAKVKKGEESGISRFASILKA